MFLAFYYKQFVLHNITIYYFTFPFFVSGCRGSAAALTGPEGMFGINQTQYENNMICGWKIQVELSKVNHFKNTSSINSGHFESGSKMFKYVVCE